MQLTLKNDDRPKFDPKRVAEMYDHAPQLETSHGTLVVKNGYPWEKSTPEGFKMLYHDF